MHSARTPALAVTLACVAAGCLAAVDDASIPEAVATAELSVAALVPRTAATKPLTTDWAPRGQQDRIVVKFAEGSHVRFNQGRFAIDPALVSADEVTRLARNRFTHATARVALTVLQDVIDATPGAAASRMFQRVSEADLNTLTRNAEMRSGEEHADLSLYHEISVPAARAKALLDALNASDLVEIAYPAPIPVSAATDILPPTPSWVTTQGYLKPGTAGIDAEYAWTKAGGNGAGMRVTDVEFSWNTSHEDLNALTPPFYGLNMSACDPNLTNNHGTASLGEIVAAKNDYVVNGIAYGGVTGIAYGAWYSFSGHDYESTCTQGTTAEAIAAAATGTPVGHVIFIELALAPTSFGVPDSGDGPANTNCTCSCAPPTQYESLPVEWNQAEFDMIKAVTAAGIIVVEPAGNGAMNLDHSRYLNRFQRSTRDSGAIMVGASASSDGQPMCFTNYGSRVDVRAWGNNVMTLGYGDVTPPGTNDPNQWYFSSFSGTSSATPMVAGAALDIQGTRLAAGQALLTPAQMRALLVSTGTPQPTPVTKAIGPMPDLRAAISPAEPAVYAQPVAVRRTSTSTVTELFAVGSDGKLYVRSVSGTGNTWTGPTAMPGTVLFPRAAGLATGMQGTSQLDVFAVGNNGTLYYFRSTTAGTWTGPTAISAVGVAKPGARIATGLRGANLNVFVVDTTGYLRAYVVVGTGTTWTESATNGSGFSMSGAHLATGRQGTNQLDVFAIGNDGALKAAYALDTGTWNVPVNLTAANVAPPGGGLATGRQGTNQLDVFYVGNDGLLKASAVVGQGLWTQPINIGLTVIYPGSPVTAAANGSNTLQAFVVDVNGLVSLYQAVGTGAWTGQTFLPTAAGVSLSGLSMPLTAAATQTVTSGSKLHLFGMATNGIGRWTSTNVGAFATFTKLP